MEEHSRRQYPSNFRNICVETDTFTWPQPLFAGHEFFSKILGLVLLSGTMIAESYRMSKILNVTWKRRWNEITPLSLPLLVNCCIVFKLQWIEASRTTTEMTNMTCLFILSEMNVQVMFDLEEINRCNKDESNSLYKNIYSGDKWKVE